MNNNNKTWNSKYFYGKEISEYGLKNGYVDYRTLAQSFDCILNNEIIKHEADYWEIYSGSDTSYYNTQTNEYVEYDDIEDWDDIEEEYSDIYQWYIISESGADILQELTNEIVYYNSKLDIYLWGITHYGTGWDYVLTDIKIELDNK